jgi:hypothetical protein
MSTSVGFQNGNTPERIRQTALQAHEARGHQAASSGA